mmetsp:Transcript_26202/g.46767  ORF Transcript_26202/g.46767 Transcript_26202/m.46767 type:complete len:555 (+) Transcript_26202:54-1718(+)
MEVSSLQGQVLYISLAGVKILLDCPLDLSMLSTTAPTSIENPILPIQFRRGYLEETDIESLDLVLVSNILAAKGLPFLNPKFRGKLLMTEPVFKLGKAVCLELVEQDAGYRHKLTAPSTLYSATDVNDIWRQVTSLRYNQIVKVRDLEITPVSAGHSLGSANWMLTWGDYSVSFISKSCMDVGRYPASFDMRVCNTDLMLFSPTVKPGLVPFNPKAFLTQVIEVFASVNRNVVLMPIDPWQVLDLEEHILSAAAIYNFPVLFLAPSAKAFLAYAAGSPEWLNFERKHRAFIPTPCFMFEKAKEKGTWQTFDNLIEGFADAMREPSIILASHSSMRLGESDFLLCHLAKESRGTHFLMLTDPEFGESALDPFQSLLHHFKIKILPVQIGLTDFNIDNLVANSHASTVLMPDTFNFLVARHPRKLQTYTSDIRMQLPSAKPQHLYIQTTDSASLSFLQMKDYRYISSIPSQIHKIEAFLETQGYNVGFQEQPQGISLVLQEGSILFGSDGTVRIVTQSEPLRAALNALVSSIKPNLEYAANNDFESGPGKSMGSRQ